MEDNPIDNYDFNEDIAWAFHEYKFEVNQDTGVIVVANSDETILANGTVLRDESGSYLKTDGKITIIVFEETISITGDLTIIGADSIIFEDSLSVGGDIILEGDEIDFEGGVDTVTTTNPNGSIILRTSSLNQNIALGEPSSSSSDMLNLTTDDLKAINSIMTKVIIGHNDGAHSLSDLGNIYIGAGDTTVYKTDFSIYGKSITVEDDVSIDGDLIFDTTQNISIDGSLTAKDIIFYSTTGSIKQISSDMLKADDLNITTTNDIKLKYIDIVSTSISQLGEGKVDIVVHNSNSVTINKLTQSLGISTEDIDFISEDGNIRVATDGISVLGSGELNLTTSNGIINIDADISAVGGEMEIKSSNNINISEDIDITNTTTKGAGAISFIAQDSIIMSDKSKISSTGDDTGEIILEANNSIELSIVQSDKEITLSGNITDNLTSSEDSNIITTNLILNSSNMGEETNDIDTTIYDIEILGDGSGDIYIQEVNSLITNSISGVDNLNIVVQAGDLTQKDDIFGSGNIVIDVVDGIIDMQNDVKTKTSGDIDYSSNSINLSILETTANISISAKDGAIIDNLSTENSNLVADVTNITSTQGVGLSGEDDIDTDITTLNLTITNINDAFIEEDNDITLNTISSSSVNGDIIIITESGSITTTGEITNSNGDIYLNSLGYEDVIVNSNITLTNGNITIDASGSIKITEDIINNKEFNTIDLISENSIEMGADSSISTHNGDIRFETNQGSVVFNIVNSGTADITILSGDNINDVDEYSLITTTNIILKATDDIGENANHLNIETTNLSTYSGKDSFITEKDDLVIDIIDEVNVNRVDNLGVSTLTTYSLTQDDINSLGGLVIQTLDGSFNNIGDITVNGDSLIKSSNDITLNGIVTITDGNISLDSNNNINMNNDIKLNTQNKTVDMKAINSVIMADDKTITTNDGSVRFEATTITLENIVLSNLVTADIIVIGDNFTIDSTIVADGLILDITNMVDIDTTINRLNTDMGNSLFVNESDNIIIDEIIVDINRVDLVGVVNIVNTTKENIDVEDDFVLEVAGTLNLIKGITAGEDILIDTDYNISLDGILKSTSGNISIKTEQDINQTGTIEADKTIYLNATDITMADGSRISASGDISLLARDTIISETITTSGNLSLVATSGSFHTFGLLFTKFLITIGLFFFAIFFLFKYFNCNIS